VALIEVDQDFGLTRRAEVCPVRSELAAELLKVVDLSVHGDGDAPVGRGHGLGGGDWIDYGQAAEAYGTATVGGEKAALLVGSSVGELGGHAFGEIQVGSLAGEGELSGESAHGGLL